MLYILYGRDKYSIHQASEEIKKNTVDAISGDAAYLVLDGAQGQIVAPARPSTYYSRLELGAGYVLVINGDEGLITAPATAINSQPVAAPITTMDLGAGYKLVLSAVAGQIVAPETPALVQPQAQPMQKIDLGSGYWLVLTPNSGQIVPEGSR